MLKIHNCIVSDNDASGGLDVHVEHRHASASIAYTILGKTNAKKRETATNLFKVKPGLGPLADNGGSTATHALLPGSPAIDAAQVSDIEFDQRGPPYSRVISGDKEGEATPDIGAFEVQ